MKCTKCLFHQPKSSAACAGLTGANMMTDIQVIRAQGGWLENETDWRLRDKIMWDTNALKNKEPRCVSEKCKGN